MVAGSRVANRGPDGLSGNDADSTRSAGALQRPADAIVAGCGTAAPRHVMRSREF